MRLAIPSVVPWLMVIFTGCQRASQFPSNESNVVAPTAIEAVVPLPDRDLDIIRHILVQESNNPSDRIYYLTLTPMAKWGETGTWVDFPGASLDAIPEVKNRYRLANGAYLKDGRVLEKGTDKNAWMKWITIKRWISDTEVEVEDGVWCCPLGGGASTVIYEKVDGKWTIKSLGESWVS